VPTDHSRLLENAIREDLPGKMVFIGGPRQVGKTTLARKLAREHGPEAYFNWDSAAHRRALLAGAWPADAATIVLDEIHKYARWKTLVKGLWDTRRRDERVIVTGSSRLDIFRRGGDSLLGRYHYHRLHPFSLRELERGDLPVREGEDPEWVFSKPVPRLAELMRFGGFPEPLFAQSERHWRRWQRERFERVFREDIRDLESVRSLGQVELLGQMLPARVRAPLSFQSLSEDLDASPKTIKSWMELLARNYYAFRVPPHHRHLARALKKESKYYLWDWSEVSDAGSRFENLIASHLLKFCHYWQDVHGHRFELSYVRDLEKREVDFLVTLDGKPWALVEAKLSPGEGHAPLAYFGERLGVRRRFLVTLGSSQDHEDRNSGVRVIPAERFLMALP
jgi:predicted AAA+ superfamily ATPase